MSKKKSNRSSSSKSSRIFIPGSEYTEGELKEFKKKRKLEKKLAKKEKKYKKELEQKLEKELDSKISKAKGRIAPLSLSVPKGTNIIWSPNPGSQVRFLMCPYDEVLLEGNRGGGKGLLPDEKILTPRGFTALKNIKVGSIISNPDGSSQKVIGVFEREKQQLYRITFADGTKLKCDADHLWFAKVANRTKAKTTRKYRPLNFFGNIHRTEDLYNDLKKYSNKRPLIPCNDPVVYQNNWDFKVNAYIIGLILGDGCISGKDTRISTADKQIKRYLKSVLKNVHNVCNLQQLYQLWS